MIVKERNREEHAQVGKVAEAATSAEEQMAFYLRRAFVADDTVFILNDLRLPLDAGGDAVQVDHLVLHPFGFVVIESKSVTGSVHINEHGEWCRVGGERRTGMKSPVVQAAMQAEALRGVLNSGLGKSSTSKPFDRVPFDVLVAISDNGLIERRCPVPEVHKADVVPTKVREALAQYRAERGAKGERISSVARERIVEFLVKRHTPRRSPTKAKGAASAATAPTAPPQAVAPAAAARKSNPTAPLRQTAESDKRCRFCGSRALHLQYGKFGYYFRCIACTKNTSIDLTCPACGAKARIRKAGLNFFKECRSCGDGRAFYVNASLIDLDDPTSGGG